MEKGGKGPEVERKKDAESLWSGPEEVIEIFKELLLEMKLVRVQVEDIIETLRRGEGKGNKEGVKCEKCEKEKMKWKTSVRDREGEEERGAKRQKIEETRGGKEKEREEGESKTSDVGALELSKRREGEEHRNRAGDATRKGTAERESRGGEGERRIEKQRETEEPRGDRDEKRVEGENEKRDVDMVERSGRKESKERGDGADIETERGAETTRNEKPEGDRSGEEERSEKSEEEGAGMEVAKKEEQQSEDLQARKENTNGQGIWGVIEWEKERQGRKKREKNLLVRGAEKLVELRDEDIRESIEEKIGEIRIAKVVETKQCGKEGQVIVELETREEKERVLKRRADSGLRGLWIQEDLTWKERQTRLEIIERENEERKKGKNVQVGSRKIKIDGIEWRWGDEKGEWEVVNEEK